MTASSFSIQRSIILAKNQYNNNEEVGKKTIKADFKYPELTPIIKYGGSDGRFSKYSNGTFLLGDGETINFNVVISEMKAEGFIEEVKFKSVNNGTASVSSINTNSTANGYSIYSGSDITKKVYKITQLYYPYYNNTNMLKLGSIQDWCWRQWWKSMSDGEDEYFVLLYTPFGNGVHTLKDMTVSQYRDSVCIWAEDHDLSGPDYKYWDETRHDFERLNTEAGWSLVKDETVSANNPLYMDAKEFEENPWFFTPGTCSKGEGELFLRWNYEKQTAMDSAGNLHNYSTYGGCGSIPHVLTSHVEATKQISTDSSVISNTLIGYLEIYVNHNGKREKTNTSIPVYYVIRECSK